MKLSEEFALNEWLSEYPIGSSYDAIIELLQENDERVTVWQWFEGLSTCVLVENIDNTRDHFARVTNEGENND